MHVAPLALAATLALVGCASDAREGRAPGSGGERAIAPIVVRVPANAAEASRGADAVVKGPLGAAVRACHQKAAARDATEEGSVTLELQLTAAGSVASVGATPRGLDEIEVQCIRHAASVELFAPPASLPATVTAHYDFPRAGSDYAVLVQRGLAPLVECAQGGAKGTLVLATSIKAEGTVRAIDVRSFDGLAKDVAACAARAISKLSFVGARDERTVVMTVDFEP